jgi:hypothetical protein
MHGFLLWERPNRAAWRLLVRKGGLEPPWVSPPDPKSGASANSATFAIVESTSCNLLLRLVASSQSLSHLPRKSKIGSTTASDM